MTPSDIFFSWVNGMSWPEYVLTCGVLMLTMAGGIALATVKWGGRS